MNNFGVIELANAKKTSAPGWAYVPDTSINLSAALKPANRKRARNAPGLSIGDLSARQEARIQKEVAALDRDGGRDNSIPLPHRGGRPQGKHTPNVRKILQSQKTFANHLDDFRAMQALAESNAATANRNAAANASKRPNGGRKDTLTTARQPNKAEDIEMTDADLPPILPSSYKPAPDPQSGDNDPLLVSRVPEVPSDEELRKLLEHPPLTYAEATGTWEQKYPVRVFCEVCGYWGRVRCMKCGTRVCALDCLETHREECVTRYGL